MSDDVIPESAFRVADRVALSDRLKLRIPSGVGLFIEHRPNRRCVVGDPNIANATVFECDLDDISPLREGAYDTSYEPDFYRLTVSKDQVEAIASVLEKAGLAHEWPFCIESLDREAVALAPLIGKVYRPDMAVKVIDL